MGIFLQIWPTATADQIAAFLYNQGGELYSRESICERLKEIGMTRKVSSTEAYQAFSPINLLKVEVFFNEPPPAGIHGVPRRMLLDADEFGISLEKCNNKYGWAAKCYRVRKPGHYTRDTKLTVLLCIEPGKFFESRTNQNMNLLSHLLLYYSYQVIHVFLLKCTAVRHGHDVGFVFSRQEEQLLMHLQILCI